MGTRTVRLDDEAESTLTEIRQLTGLSVSSALKSGLIALREDLIREPAATPYEIYESLDLGPGGYASAPARKAKHAVREVIRQKHGR